MPIPEDPILGRNQEKPIGPPLFTFSALFRQPKVAETSILIDDIWLCRPGDLVILIEQTLHRPCGRYEASRSHTFLLLYIPTLHSCLGQGKRRFFAGANKSGHPSHQARSDRDVPRDETSMLGIW